VSHNTLINKYWAQCVRCHKVHAEKLFPRSKTEPWLPGLWCKRCQAKIDRPPRAKVKKQRAAKPVTEEQTGVSREFLDKLAKTLLPVSTGIKGSRKHQSERSQVLRASSAGTR